MTIVVTLMYPTHTMYDTATLVSSRYDTNTTSISQSDEYNSSLSSPQRTTTASLVVQHPSRVMWNGLQPCLFDSSKEVCRSALRIILQSYIIWNSKKNAPQKCDEPGKKQDTIVIAHDDSSDREEKRNVRLCTRKIRIHSIRTSDDCLHLNNINSMRLWIHPPNNSKIEYLWEGLLLQWENRLIQAQSFAGYIATLGGGYFLCHHFHSAFVLATQQKRLALLLSDESMYYKCYINQAYNLIYAGKFDSANKLLRLLVRELSSRHYTSDSVLIKMCRSARLFSKRMHKASKTLLQNSEDARNSVVSKTVDNYQRIRVIHVDQSRDDDLQRPFQ